MDNQRDFHPFQRLVAQLCETFGKPITDDLVQSYWKSLRNCDLAALQARADELIAKADEGTKFPRPAQLRPKDVPLPAEADGTDWKRGFWRSLVLQHLEDALMLARRIHTRTDAEAYLIANREEMGASIGLLLDELNGDDMTNQDKMALHYRECRRVVQNVVHAHLHRLGLPTNAPRST